ncbi:hypothetical protein PybrP1_002809 [[Pythium] brassicae (nom. inval.)]|nr:hypothetical protein PybrP1_002809 [[Pythium] brassicae (nom. inval.)]
MDPATPRLPETPGIPRPRTRGARRRVQTASSTFPLLFSGRRPPIATTAHLSSNQVNDARSEDESRLHADALRSRLQTTGLKRSLVQAQLFPEGPSNQQDASHCGSDQPLSLHHARARGDRKAFVAYDASSADNKPLASSRAHMIGGALIPSRPTTSSALAPRTGRQAAARAAPHSAREVPSLSLAPDTEPLKVPMSARDRYYVEKRAVTAPSSSELQGNKRRPLVPSSQSVAGNRGRDDRERSHPQHPRPDASARKPDELSQSQAKGATVELPRRRELLSQTSGFKTLAESIAEQMRARAIAQGGGGVDVSLRSAAAAPNEDPVSGAAVPRDSFLYLRRVDSNPYSLSLTTHAHIDPDDYYTVSRLGVTHFAHNSSEFMTMEKFERENYLYSLIVKRYRVWKRFALWKHALNARKRADATVSLTQNLFILLPHLHDALLHLRHGCIDLLRVHLFAFDGESASPLQEVTRNATSEDPRHQKTYTLTEFSTRLKAQKMVCERLVDQFIAQSGIIAKQACEKFLYDFLQGTGFNSSRSHDGAKAFAGSSRRASLCATPKAEARRKSILAALPKFDPELKMTYTERATMRTQCRRMTQFLRVVEFFLSDALLQMAITSAERLRQEMARLRVSGGGERGAGDSGADVRSGQLHTELSAFGNQSRMSSAPLIRVEVALHSAAPPLLGAIAADSGWAGSSRARIVRRNSGLLALNPSKPPSPVREMCAASSDQLTFAPNMELLRSQVDTLIFNGLKAVTNRERLLCNPMFRTYVEAGRDDGAGAGDDEGDAGELASESMDLDILIMEDAAFVETLQGINSILLDAYDLAEAACRVLSPFLEKYKANVLFCKSLSDPRCLETADADEFRQLLGKYLREIQMVDELPDESPCGLLLLDKAKLNAVLKPSPRGCLERLQILIPIVIRQKNECFMRELTASNERISSIPSSVDEFAATLAYLRELQASVDDLDDRYSVLKNLYQLVDDFNIRLTDADQMNAFLISQKRAQLRTSMELFENSCDQYTTKFGIELEARIPGLASRLVDISKSLGDSSLFQLESNAHDVIAYLSKVEKNLLGLEEAVERHFFHEKTLALPQTTAFEEMPDVKTDLALKMDLWRARSSWHSSVLQWERLVFPKEVDVAGIAEQIQDYYAQILVWEKSLSPGMHILCAHLKASVDEYRLTMPILSDLQCPSFEARHFAELQTLLGFSTLSLDHDRLKDTALTLGKLVTMQLAPLGPQISRVATEATQERILKEVLDKIISVWEHMKFEVKAYKDTKDAYVLVAYENIYASLEESLVSITAILSSKYLAPIKEIALMWQKRLTTFQETLDAWIECQRKWMHLETIFVAPDIQKQLPNEAILFVGVNQFWKDLMRRARDQKNCLKVSGAIFAGFSSGSTVSSGAGHAVLDTMLKHNVSLERIEKSLEDYLETKRGFFPRFYFISNDELLEILAHAKEPQSVQRHLCKCFDALVKLELSGADASHPTGAATNTVASTQNIVAMISPEGERVPFGRNLKARGNVEDWLNAVLINMRTTLHRSIKNCLLDCQHSSRETWIFRHPAQAVAVVSYIMWARECEICFRSASQDPRRELKLWHQTICMQLSNLTRLVRSSLTRLQRSLVVSLVTTDVHFRDVVDDLVTKKVTSADDFVWTQQLRYYWHAEHDDCDTLSTASLADDGLFASATAGTANWMASLDDEVDNQLAGHGLQLAPVWKKKILELFTTLDVRTGVVQTGASGSGKSTAARVLKEALTTLRDVKAHPSSKFQRVVSASKDAVAGADKTTLVRLNAKHRARVFKFFDTFVDAGIAFLRSSGSHQRSSSSGSVRATASKVPIHTSDLTFVTSVCHIFQSLLLYRVPSQLFAPVTAAAIPSGTGGGGGSSAAAAAAVAALEEQQLRCLDLLFFFSYAWSFGGNLHVDEFKQPFQDFVLEQILSHEQPLLSTDLLAINGKIPTPRGMTQVTDNIHDFFIDFQHMSFSPWENLAMGSVPRSVTYHPDTPLSQVLVPTADVVRYTYLTELLVLDARKPVLLTGATGSGKSVIVKHFIDAHSRESTDADNENGSGATGSPSSPTASAASRAAKTILPIVLQFSAQTSSAVTQMSLESKFAKKRKTLLGAPPTKDLVVIFIDDVNLPSVERLGAQPPIELLRQYLEFKGFYDRDKFFWKEVADSVLLAVGGFPGGGRHALCPRFVRHFAGVFCLPSSDDESMRTIFRAIMAEHVAVGAALSKSVRDALLLLVDATCQLCVAVARDLLPSPSKCHYLFNLRDVAKLMQGVVLGTQRFCGATDSGAVTTTATPPVSALTADGVAKLWAHESIRVFRDRLVDEADRLCFSEHLVAVASTCLGYACTLESVYQVGQEARRRSAVEPAKCVPLLFGVPPSRGGARSRPRGHSAAGGYAGLVYEEITDLAAFEDELGAAMAQYNETRRQGPDELQLVFFRDAIVHVAAISRILVQPRGHALLLGMCGSGKRSLTRLSAYLNGYRCVEIEVKKPYGVAEFREDLKVAMMETVLGKQSSEGGSTSLPPGASGGRRASGAPVRCDQCTPTVLLLNDSQLVSDALLDDINTLLSSGEIPKLFSLEEREKIIAEARPLLLSANAQHAAPRPMLRTRATSGQEALQRTPSVAPSPEPSRKDCEAFFLAQVHQHMHIALCLSPAGDAFRARVRSFPSLIHCTTIVYFDDWPSSALQYVAERYLSQASPESSAEGALSHATKSALGVLCVEVHRSIGGAVAAFFAQRRRRVVVAPQHFLDLIALFQRLEADKRGRLGAKLQRLTTGVVKLDETNALVSTLQDELVALQPVLVEKAREAELLLQRVSVDQAEASQVAARVASDESRVKQQQQAIAACQADAQSDLDRALPALAAAVTALDSLDKKDITEVKGFVKPPQAVQVVMEAVCIMLGEKPDWDTSKRVLSRSSLLAELKEYDKDSIAPAILKRVRKYIESPEFAVDEVKKVSRAAMSLCMWVHAVDTYARVHKDVAPKRQRLAEMNTVLAGANAALAEKQRELGRVLESVRALKQQCDATLAEKQRLVTESELTQARLQRAERLTAGLSDERERWRRSMEQLKEEGTAVVGNAFLAAASVAYLGPFDGGFRAQVLRHWLAFAASLLDVSSEFALVDVAPGGLCVVKCSDSALARVLEQCLSTGTPLLVEDVSESLEPSLEPVLCRAAMRASAATGASKGLVAVNLGDRVVEVDPRKFRLYLTTKLANPAFAPDVFIRTSVINFTVTRAGLEDQLLSDVVKKERPEVEARKHTLLASIAQDEKLLQGIELKILSLLSEANGAILDDLELIQALETSKQTSTVVARRLGESETTQQEVLHIRDQYAPIAARGALLYFVVADLVRLDPMYQYSLEYFARLFNVSLDEAPPSAELPRRLALLEAHLTRVVYRNICRGLFEAHKLLFALVVCLRVQVTTGEVGEHDVGLLEASTLTLDAVSHAGARPHGGGSRQAEARDAADVLVALAAARAPFGRLLESYQREPSAWSHWVASASPYATSLPGSCDERLPLFYRLVLVRWLRGDTFVDAMRSYVRDRLGACFVESERLAMAEVYCDMDKATPCLFILSSGADPKGVVDRFARETGVYDDKYHVISLGQGQGPVAEALMERCMRNGHWLALLNVHLAKSWLPRLQRRLAATRAAQLSDVHDGYRLFLASFPADYFPIAILQNSVKVICEPPKGIKANLRRSMGLLVHADEPIDAPASGEGKSEDPRGEEAAWFRKVQLQLAFGLSFFHAVIQERVKFGSLGWNLKYDFSDADFLSVLALQKRLLHGAHSVISRKSRLARHGSMMLDPEPNGDEPPGANSVPRYRVPWDALDFLTAEIYYGGRVTDECDRRCLMANLRRFCSPATLNLAGYAARERPTEELDQDEATARLFPLFDDQFCCPEFGDHDEMTAFVDSLPQMDAPFVFGMHPNAHIYCQEQEAQRFVAELGVLHPTTGGGRDEAALADTLGSAASSASAVVVAASPEQEVVSVAQEIQTKLPVPQPIPDAKLASSPKNGLVDPLRVVLHQELAKCHALLQYVHERLDAVQKAIKGVVVMSHCIEDVVHSLSLHQVPLEWRRMEGSATVSTFTAFSASSTSPPLGHWVNQLLFRYGFLHRWRADGAPPNDVYPLSIFCFPQGFFTALLQRHARKYVVPIHHLEFQFDVVSSELDSCQPREDISAPGQSGRDARNALERTMDDGEGGEDSGEDDSCSVLDGAYISGMFLEGARWDEEKRRLCDPEPGVMHHPMPTIHVLPHVAREAGSASTVSPSLLPVASASTPAALPGAASQSRTKGGAVSTPRVSLSLLPACDVAHSPHRKSTLETAVLARQSHADSASRAEEAISASPAARSAPAAFKYSCPVYKTPARKGVLSTTGISTNYVLAIELPCERAPEHYALNGTALVCNISD